MRGRFGWMLPLVAALASSAGWAQGSEAVIRVELPVLLEPPPPLSAFSDVSDPSYSPRVPEGEAGRALLEEAYWLVGGMIRGFNFAYTPSDKSRSIAELFTAEPLFPETADGTGFRVASVRQDGNEILATMEYALDAEAAREMATWSSSGYATSKARGSVSAFEPADRPRSILPYALYARRDAVLAASREAIRAYLRDVTHNKPREVRGSFAFASAPRIFIKNGQWMAEVRVYISVLEITSYGAY